MTMYYKWSKAFLESGKNGLTLDTKRDATTDGVRHLREENQDLKPPFLSVFGKAVLIQLRYEAIGDAVNIISIAICLRG